MKSIINRIVAAAVTFYNRPNVQTVARHAATAFVGSIVAIVAVGGIHAVTTAVVIGAAAAAARVIWVAVQGYVASIKVGS